MPDPIVSVQHSEHLLEQHWYNLCLECLQMLGPNWDGTTPNLPNWTWVEGGDAWVVDYRDAEQAQLAVNEQHVAAGRPSAVPDGEDAMDVIRWVERHEGAVSDV